MIDKIRLIYTVVKNEFTVGFSNRGERGAGYMVGRASGISSILASVVLAQMAGRLRDKYVETLVDDGYARHSGKLLKDWNGWIEFGTKNPYDNPADFINLEKGDANG